MKTSSWLRRLAGRKNRTQRPRQRFSERFAATLSIKPLESRLVLNATTLDLTATGFLTLTDTSPFQNDSLSIAPDAANQRYVIKDNTVGGTMSLVGTAAANGATIDPLFSNTAYVPFSKVTATATNAITVNLADGNDSLTIDLTNGELVDNLTFNGGNPTTGSGDSLTLIGGAKLFPSVGHTATNAADGSITIAPSIATNDPTTGTAITNRTITYVGLEPITDNLIVANRDFTFNGGAETITFQDSGTANDGYNIIDSTLSESITFRNPTTSLTIHAGSGDDTVIVNRLDDTLAVGPQIFGDAGTNKLTIATTDRPTASPVFAFAGFMFDQTGTPDEVVRTTPGVYDGVAVTAVAGSPTNNSFGFPETPTTGFLDNLTLGRMLNDGSVPNTGSRAINLPAGNVGTVVRSAIEVGWVDANKALTDQTGDDFVIYESASNLTGPDGFIVQVHEKGGAWTRWRYESPDGRELYVGSATEGAFSTGFDLASFGLAGKEIDGIRIASLTGADRIEGTGVETTVGSGVYRGQGYVLPDDGGVTSDTFPDPGAFASFTFFGSATFDPDPLYVGMLHPLATASNTRSDTILVNGNQVTVTTEGVLKPVFTHTGFGELTVNSAGGVDRVTVQLGGAGLPSSLIINGGDPNSGDTLVVSGNDSAADTLSLANSTITVTGGPTIAVSAVERLEIETDGDANIDRTTINRSFTLSGVNPSINVKGDAGIDELTVDTEAPPAAPSGLSFTAAGVTFYQDATPDTLATLPLGAITGGFGASVTSTSYTTNSLTGFPETGTGFNEALSLGREHSGGSGIRRLNLSGGNNRNAFQVTWSNNRTLQDQAGVDLVFYEQGTAKTVAGGGPEAFMIQVHDPNTGAWSQWRYNMPTSQTTPDGASTTRFATVFDLQQFVTADFQLAGGKIDAIRVANLIPGDMVSGASGEGFVTPSGQPPNGPVFTPQAPASLSTYTNYTAGTLTPDMVYIGVTHDLAAPILGGSDTVSIDGGSVKVQGFIPIGYTGLERVTVNTAGGADFIKAKPSTNTAYTLNMGDPAPPTTPTDRLEFDLTDEDDAQGNTGAVLTITDPGVGTLVLAGRRDISVTGVDGFGVPPTTGVRATFDVVINSASASAANSPASDTFFVDRDLALTRVTVNGEIVFRGDVAGLRNLTINGSADPDTLTVDFTNDDPISKGGLFFNGLGGTNQLFLQNGTVEKVTHTATSDVLPNVGRVDIDHYSANNAGALTTLRSTITYTGLNAATHDELITKQRTFELSGAADDVQILDATGAGRSRVINRSPSNTFVDVEFLNPTVGLTLNGGGGNDTFGLEGIDPAFVAAVNLYGGSGNDTFNIGGSGSVAFVKFPVNIQGNAPLDPLQPGGTGVAINPNEDDRIFIDDSADVDGSVFNVTETTVGGENLPSGAAVGSTTPNVNGAVGGGEWDHVPVAFASGARPGLSQQTILHWLTVDGTGRILIDDSPNGNNGTLFAPTGPVFRPGQGQFGGALEFDGVDDYAWFKDASFNVGAEGTFSFWVFMDDQSRRNAFLNTSDSFPGEGFEVEFRTNNGGELFAYLNKTVADGSSGSDNSLLLQKGDVGTQVPNQGQWFNIQLTWDFLNEGTNTVIEQAHLYVNGSEVTYASGFGNPVTNWNQTVNTINTLMQLGRHRTETTRYFDGKMDDVAFFNKALGTTDLTRIRTQDVASAQAAFGGMLNTVGNGNGSLIAYWNLDNPVGTAIAAGNAGTNINLNIGPYAEGAQFIPNGGPTPPNAAGPLGAVEFDGDHDTIVVNDSATLDFNKSQGTIAFWINPAAEQARDTLIGNTSTLIEDSTGQIEVGISWQSDSSSTLDHADMYGRVFLALKGNSPNEPTNVLVSDSRLKFSDWTHVVITWETVGGQVQAKMYFNGQDDGQLLNRLNATNLSAVNTGAFTFGGDAATTPLNRWFEGRLADISIWGAPLSAERVDHTFRYGAATTNAWDYSGASAKFAWDATNLYGLVTDYTAGPGAANGQFNDLVVDLYDSNGALLRTISVGAPNGATIAPAGSTDSYEFSVPFALLGGFDPNSTGFLQYKVRTRDANAVDLNNQPLVAGFDSGLTTLGYVTPPLAGTSTGLAKLNFVGRETLFGVGGRLTYHGAADLEIRTGSGVDNVTLSNDPLVNGDATANAARSFTLLTGAGADNVTIASLDAGFLAQTTIRTNSASLTPAADGIDTITQLAAFTLGSARSNGELYLEADQILLDANSSTKGKVKIDGAVTLTSDVRIDTTFAGSAGQDIWFTNFSTINSEAAEANNLVLNAALGRVFFNADIGAVNGGELGRLEIQRAAEIVFGQANTSTPATGQGPVTLVRVTGDGTAAPGIDLGSLQAIGVNGITLNGGAGNLLRMQTTGDAIRVNGAVKLATDVVFDTDTTDNNTQGGAIRFTSAAPIDSATQKNLSFDAGTASVFLNANLGNTSPLGAITVDEADGGVTFGETSPVNFVRATGAVNIGVGANVIGGTGITLNGGGTGFTLTTTDQNVRFNGKVTLQSDARIDTGPAAGDIVFTSDSPIESPTTRYDLTLNAGTGAVEFNANLGATDRLKKLTIEVAKKITFGAANNAVTGGPGPVTTVRTDDAVNLGSLATVTDGVIFNGGANPLTIDTTSDLIRVNGAVTLASDVRLATGGGDILFTLAAPIDSSASEANNLVLEAGAATVRFNNNLGSATNGELGRLVIERAGAAIFGEANTPAAGQGPVTLVRVTGDGSVDPGVDLGSLQSIASIVFNGGVGDQFRMESTGNAIRVNGATQFATQVTLDTDQADNDTQGGNITFTSAAPIDSAGNKAFTLDAGTASVFFSANLGGTARLGSITVNEADGGVTFGDTAAIALVRSTGAVNIGVGANVIGGTGITFNGGVGGLTLSTTDQNVRLNGRVTLLGDTRIDTGGVGAGDIVFTSDSPIDSPLARHDLVLNAGTGTVEFNANLGATDRLKKLTVEIARQVTFGGANVAVTGGAGPVTIVRTDDAIDLGSAAVVTDGVIFNGGANPLLVSTTGDSIRVNGPVQLSSDVVFDTDSLDNDTHGGNVLFTSAAPIDSATQKNLSFDAGTASVLFNANVGANQAIGSFTVDEADGGVTFGDTTAITTVRTNGPVDIGVGGNVIGGTGIRFNGGVGLFTLSTADQNVRLNGAVTLLSNVRIDTGSVGAGNVLFTANSPVDSSGSSHDLTLNTGTGAVEFNANLGGTNRLKKLTVEIARQLTFGGTNPVTLIRTDDAIDLGSVAVIADGIIFNGGVNPLVVSTTGDSIRVNGPTQLTSAVVFDTDATDVNSQGGIIVFTSAAPIDSAAQKNLSFDAGTASVLFNANLGANQALGAFTVDEADGGVTFGDTTAITTVNTNGPVDIGVGANVITGTGIIFNGAGLLTLSTADQNVRLNGAVTLLSDVRIDTGSVGAGNVLFTANSPVESSGSPRDLTLNTGTGAVEFNANLGAANRLKKLTVEIARQLTFGGTSPVTLVRTDDAVDLGSLAVITDGIIFNGGANPLLVSTTGDLVRANGPVQLSSAVVVDTDSLDNNTHGGNVLFTSAAPIDSAAQKNLSFDAGTASVFFNANIGSGQAIGALTVDEADGGVTFGDTTAITTVRTNGPVDIGVGANVIGGTGIRFNGGVGLFTLSTADQNVRLNGAVTLLSDVRIDTGSVGAGNVLFTANSPVDSSGGPHDLTLNTGTGAVEFNANLGGTNRLKKLTVEIARQLTFGGTNPVTSIRTDDAIDLGSVAVIADGVIFNGGVNPLLVSTTGDSVRVNGAVQLSSDVVFDTDSLDNNSHGGNVLFTSAAPIDSAGQKNLSFDAGTASVLFNANLGANQALGAFTFNEADGGVTFGDTTAVTTIRTTGPVDIGVGANVITGTGITFNGGLTGLTLTTADQIIRLNGAVTLLSDVRLDTGSVGAGNIVFTSDTPIESPGQARDLTLNTGTGAVEFNANLGATNRLKKLTIEIARLVIFGAADVAVTGGAGPVTIVRTDDAINLGSAAVVTDGVIFNGGANELAFTTTGDLIRVNGATTLQSDLRFTTAGGNVFFTAAAPIDSDPSGGNDFTLDTAAGDITFSAAVGAVNPLAQLTILSADDVTFLSVLQTTGAVTQSAGTGLTRFNGTTGGGIGGVLNITADRVEFGTSDVVTIGAVTMSTQNAITFLANAGLNATASTISLFANLNGGPEGFTQDSSALIQTTNDTAAAVLITVGGTGDARISRIHTGTAAAGTITIVAGGAISDNRNNEDANLVTRTADLTAGSGIGAMNNDLDSTVAFVTAFTATQDFVLDETNDITLRNITADTGTVFVNAGGVLSIQNGDVLESLTGRASNAPPLLTLAEDNPADVLLPGDPTQEVRGQIGAGGLNAGNLEFGENFTLVVTWDDGKTSVLGGLSAGDNVVWLVDANNNSTVTITPGPAPGPIDIFIQRTYPLPYLQLLNKTEVTAQFTLFNDSMIRLFDATPINLNQTVTFGIDTSISKKDFGVPTLAVVEEALVTLEEPVTTILLETPPLVPVQQIIFRQDLLIEDKKEEEEAVLYLVRVGPDGAEGKQIRLPLDDLRDLARLLEKLKKTQMPSGLYRIYHQEPGQPPRKVLEFRKAGNMIGDPIREPGRGANPQEESGKQGDGANEELPPTDKPAGTGAEGTDAASDAKQASLDAALREVTAASFTRAARLRRRG